MVGSIGPTLEIVLEFVSMERIVTLELYMHPIFFIMAALLGFIVQQELCFQYRAQLVRIVMLLGWTNWQIVC